MNKSPEMEKLLDELAKAAFGRNRTDSIRSFVCVTCGDKVGELRDELSAREFRISGMCQKCQDSVFGG